MRNSGHHKQKGYSVSFNILCEALDPANMTDGFGVVAWLPNFVEIALQSCGAAESNFFIPVNQPTVEPVLALLTQISDVYFLHWVCRASSQCVWSESPVEFKQQ